MQEYPSDETPDTLPEAVQSRLAELEQQAETQRAELARARAESVKAQMLLEWPERLPGAYQAQVVASENAEEVKESLRQVTEQFQADRKAFGSAARPVGAPPAGPGAVAHPRWHGKRPSEISPRDWPTYKRQVLGLR